MAKKLFVYIKRGGEEKDEEFPASLRFLHLIPPRRTGGGGGGGGGGETFFPHIYESVRSKDLFSAGKKR